MTMRDRLYCDGCNLVIPQAARLKEEYDKCFGYHWHTKTTCIDAMCRRIGGHDVRKIKEVSAL